MGGDIGPGIRFDHGPAPGPTVTVDGMAKSSEVRDAGRCEKHRKMLFLSRANARRVRKRYPGTHMDIFQCDERKGDNLWHLGNMPPTVFRGITDRADVVSLPRPA